MKINRFQSRGACAVALADAMTAEIRSVLSNRPRASLALSGGSSPKSVLPRLAEAKLAWERVDVTLTDERWVPPTDENSNAKLVEDYFLARGAGRATMYPLWSAKPSPADGLNTATRSVRACGLPIDIAYLGLGLDGHFASLFPVIDLAEFGITEGCVAARAPSPPTARISLSLPTILSTACLYMQLVGEEKRAVFETASAGPPIPSLPVSVLLHAGHPNLHIFMAD